MESKKIAYFGAEGAFTHLAALQLCSENKDLQLVNENFIRISDAENILSEKKSRLLRGTGGKFYRRHGKRYV